MKVFKEKFENKVDEFLKKFSGKNLDPLLKDLSDCLVFSCVYGGKNDVNFEKLTIKDFNQKEVGVEQFVAKSYDNVYVLTLSYAENYFKFEKVDDCNNYKYTSEYVFDKAGNFERQAYLKNEQLGKKQEIVESLKGTTAAGIYFVDTQEKFSNLQVCCFKLPNFEKSGENAYIKYKTKGDEPFMCKCKTEAKLPFLECLGMNTLSNLLSAQFENEKPLIIEDKKFFNKLLESSVEYYQIKKATKKASK